MKKKEIQALYPSDRCNVLLILHHLQNCNPRNYLSEEDLEWIADYLNITRGMIYGIASYYTMFSLKPRGRHIIRVCNSPVCHMFGELSLMDELTRNLKIAPGETTKDGLFTLEHTECIGCCDQAPAMMIDQEVFGHLTGPKVCSILAHVRKHDKWRV